MSSDPCVTIRAAIASRMRSILLFVLLLTAMPLPCAAQRAGAAKSMTGLVEISADLNGDGVKDRAVLLYDIESDDVDLAIYTSADGKLQDQPSVYVASLGWAGNVEGATPEMTVDGACSVDFLSGEGTRNGKPVKVPGPPPLLSVWSEKSIPAVCTFF
jgi:hypothetical protein